MSKMRDIINLRDLGGYKTKDNRVVKHNLLFRSGALDRMNEEELNIFKKLNIKYILDFRSKSEVELYPDPLIEGITYINCNSVVSDGQEIDFSPNGMRQIGEEGKQQFSKLHAHYCQMPFNNESLHVLVDNVVKRNVPLLFHCASGKDRTGVGAIVLLALLGCSEETIMQDYLLSNEILKDRIASEMEKSKDLIEKDPEIVKLLQMMEGVLEDMGYLVMDVIKEKYGDFDKYFLEEFKIDKKELEAIRDYYLE